VAEISASVPQTPTANAFRQRPDPAFFAEFSRPKLYSPPKGGGDTSPVCSTHTTPGVLRYPYLERYP